MLLHLYFSLNKQQMRNSHNDSSRSQLGLFQRLDRYARSRNIFLKQFWSSNRICLNFDEFIELADMVGFTVEPQDMEILKESFPQQLITLKGLQSKVSLWQSEVFNITDFVQQKAADIIKQSSLPVRSTQSVPKHRNKPCASLHNQTSEFDITMRTLLDDKKRLKQHRDKMRRSELMLQKSIIKNQNEGEFELVLKIAEINEISSKLKTNISYTISKQENRVPIITKHKADGQKEVIKDKQFLKEYILLKQQSINKATYEKQTSTTDLKTTLIETMYLSQQLQQQMQLIRSRGITSDCSLR